jgi:general secretion pathway protein J
MKTSPRHRAFTLLEIMVALALLSVIIVAIYSSWRAILKGTAVAREVASASQRTRITMRTLEDSLLCACMFNANPSYYTFEGDGDSDFSSFSFVARLPRSFPRSGKFGDLDVRRLSFGVEPGPDSTKQLVLRQNPILMEMDKDEQENPLVLARNVQTFLVEYIDPKTGEWVPDWVNSNTLPREVRIQLAINHADRNITEPLEVMIGTVAMPGQVVRTEWELPMNAASALGPINTGPPGANNAGQQSGQSPVTKQ